MIKIQPFLTLQYPLGGVAIPYSENVTFTWLFKDPSPLDSQQSYYMEYKEAIVGSQLLNTGWVTSNQSKHTFNAHTFANAKNFAWRVKVKDNNNIESNFSEWVLFKTTARPSCNITFPQNDNDNLTSDIATFTHSYSDLTGQLQTSYQYRLYNDSDLLLWTSDLFKDQNNLVVLPKGLLEQSTYYKVDVTVTDADGLSNTSIKRRFYCNFPTSLSNTTYFQVTPDNENSKLDLKWANSKSIMGVYQGSGERYKVAKFGNGIEIKNSGEKVYYDINIPEIFTITNWVKYNAFNNGTLLYLYKDAFNWLKLFYSVYDEKFIIEKNTNGNMRVIGSPTVTLIDGQPIFYSIKQTTSGLICHTGVNGVLTKWGDNI